MVHGRFKLANKYTTFQLLGINRKRKAEELEEAKERRHKEKMQQRQEMFRWFQDFFMSKK